MSPRAIETLYGAETAHSIAEGLVLDWNLDAVPHAMAELSSRAWRPVGLLHNLPSYTSSLDACPNTMPS